MLTAKALSYVLPDGQTLFQNLNFTIESKKYGLVGVNGVGKSTLMRILAGDLIATSGQLIGDAQVVYLPQSEPRSVMTAGEYLVDIWESPETRLREILLKDIDLSLGIEKLSGGQWMRVRLMHAIAKGSDVFIIDEPTNDLDREARQILYEFTENYRGTLLVISHDRELLNYVDEIWELTNQGLGIYGGNFSFYEVEKEKEREHWQTELDRARREKNKQHREEIEKIDKQLKRSANAQKNVHKMGLPKILLGARKRQAQKSLGKITSQEQERSQRRTDDFHEIYKKQKQSSEIRMDFSLAEKAKGKNVFLLEDFNFRYKDTDNKLWSKDLNCSLQVGGRLVIRGNNGAGKSTLLKILVSQISESAGESFGVLSPIKRTYAYLDQNYSLLSPSASVLETILGNSAWDQIEIRNKLADFKFTGSSVFKSVQNLSGGERLRLCLASLIMRSKPPQVWILDEPTNNLDLDSLEVLEDTLRKYKGSLIVVSHDETFLERVTCGQELVLWQQKKG